MTVKTYTINNWTHDPSKRKRRFRCPMCNKIIPDGTDIKLMTNRTTGGGWGQTFRMGALGFHSDCYDQWHENYVDECQKLDKEILV